MNKFLKEWKPKTIATFDLDMLGDRSVKRDRTIELHIKEFPILESDKHEECPKSIPWALVRPHEQQAIKNHDRTLTELAMRGGLDPVELYRVMNNQPLIDLKRDQYKAIAVTAVDFINEAIETHKLECIKTKTITF